MILETERLILREMTDNDYDALAAVLTDSSIMQHYPYTFDEARVRSWISRNRDRYVRDGFGLWAVCLKENGEMIGDCGLTLQPIDGKQLPEIGYHIRRDLQRRGYAREAAAAVRDWAFTHTAYPALYSYCKYTNEPSRRTAESIGMRFLMEYPDDANGITHVSVITKKEYLLMSEERMNMLTDRMIAWAEAHLGNSEYAGRCLSFAEDALEIGNGIEIFGGDSARESYDLYRDALRTGEPERGAFVFYDCMCQSETGPVNWGHCGICCGEGRIIHAWNEVRVNNYQAIESLTALTGDQPRYLGWVPVERILRQEPEA